MTNTKQLEPTAEEVRNALEKQAYSQPVYVEYDSYDLRCPSCETYIAAPEDNYCRNCGQRIAPPKSEEGAL